MFIATVRTKEAVPSANDALGAKTQTMIPKKQARTGVIGGIFCGLAIVSVECGGDIASSGRSDSGNVTSNGRDSSTKASGGSASGINGSNGTSSGGASGTSGSGTSSGGASGTSGSGTSSGGASGTSGSGTSSGGASGTSGSGTSSGGASGTSGSGTSSGGASGTSGSGTSSGGASGTSGSGTSSGGASGTSGSGTSSGGASGTSGSGTSSGGASGTSSSGTSSSGTSSSGTSSGGASGTSSVPLAQAYVAVTLFASAGGMCVGVTSPVLLLSIGSMAGLGRDNPTRVPDGSDNDTVHVSCAVQVDGTGFDISLSARSDSSSSGGTLSITGSGITSAAGGVNLSGTFEGVDYGQFVFSDCALTYSYDNLTDIGGIASGRIWAHVTCPGATTTDSLGDPSTCDIAADFVFENCSQ